MGDALTEVLDAVRMSGGVFLDGRFTAPWSVSISMGLDDFEPYLANPKQIVAYHYVVSGRMSVVVQDGETLEVRAGEAILLVRNDGHLLGSASDIRPLQARHLVRPGEPGGLAQMVHGGGGEATHIICGFLGSSEHRNPLLATLPRALKVDLAGAGSSELVEASLSYAIKGLQQGKVGSARMMSKLSELMFVEAVRGYAASLPPEGKGWLAGMRDAVVGRALALMHGAVSHPWTADELASEVALSRSTFTDRFASSVGMPPMRYLTFWRMQLACEKLRSGRQAIAQIAYDVGYEAEEAFTRAFKREFGTPPATWRKAVQQL